MHSGILRGLPPLEECQGDSNHWGVERPASVVVSGVEYYRPILSFKFNDIKYRLFRHPHYFISEDIKAWYRSYENREYTAKPLYEDMPVLWGDYCHIYTTYLQKFEAIANG